VHHFSTAPWATCVKLGSSLGTVALVAAGYAASRAIPPSGLAHLFGSVVACVPPAIALGAALFAVRGYELGPAHLRVQRLLWTTELTLVGLQRVWHDPEAMKGSLRLFGNGGMFSITGLYRNRALGRYRAFATDPKSSVVLVQRNRVLIVTPVDPRAFVEAVRGLFPDVEVAGPGGERHGPA
jgi:hypothetical protein